MPLELLRWVLPVGGLLLCAFIIQDLQETKRLLTVEVDRLQVIVEEERARYERIEHALVRLEERDAVRAQSEQTYRDALSKARTSAPKGQSVLDVIVPVQFLDGLRAYRGPAGSVQTVPAGVPAHAFRPPTVTTE